MFIDVITTTQYTAYGDVMPPKMPCSLVDECRSFCGSNCGTLRYVIYWVDFICRPTVCSTFKVHGV